MTPLSRIENPVSRVRREPYAVARTASPKLHNYFAGKAAKLSEVSGEIGAVPDAETGQEGHLEIARVRAAELGLQRVGSAIALTLPL